MGQRALLVMSYGTFASVVMSFGMHRFRTRRRYLLLAPVHAVPRGAPTPRELMRAAALHESTRQPCITEPEEY